MTTHFSKIIVLSVLLGGFSVQTNAMWRSFTACASNLASRVSRYVSKQLPQRGHTFSSQSWNTKPYSSNSRFAPAITAAAGATFLFGYGNKIAHKEPMELGHEKVVRYEGYWASSKNPKKDRYNGKYPFPKPNPEPWKGQEEFLYKLYRIQIQKLHDPREGVIEYRGHAMSRIEPNFYVGTREFVDAKNGIHWTEGLYYYIAKHNIKPSPQFYDFVMDYPEKQLPDVDAQEIRQHIQETRQQCSQIEQWLRQLLKTEPSFYSFTPSNYPMQLPKVDLKTTQWRSCSEPSNPETVS